MKDLLTGEEFTPKRTNQKFATAKNRTIYHNQIAATERHANAKLDVLLRNNKRILDILMKGRDELTVTQEFLRGKGFSYNVLNRILEIEKGFYPCVYQYIILNDSKSLTTKIKRDDRY